MIELVPLWDVNKTTNPHWHVYGLSVNGSCKTYESFQRLKEEKAYKVHAAKLLIMLDNIAKNHRGVEPYIFNGSCHEAIAGSNIYRLRQGVLRLYFFYDRDKVIICSDLKIKRQDKLKRSEEDALIQSKKLYEENRKSTLIIDTKR